MKAYRGLLALLLALALSLSCLSGAAWAREQSRVPALRGFQSEAFRQSNTYRFRAEETVRAIVCLEGEPAAKAEAAAHSAAETRLERQQSQVLEALDREGVAYTQVCAYRELLNGLALELPYGALERLAALPGVESVHIANRYALPQTEPKGAPNALTGISWAQSQGFRGSGMVIAVLDSGVCPEHEAFGVYAGSLNKAALSKSGVEAFCKAQGRGRWLSAKLPYVYDYADGDTDPADSGSGHGTYTAGLAAGYAPKRYEGAAPDAQLLIMKIYSDQGAYTDSALYFQALEDAWRLGADVIDLSLGEVCGFSYDRELEDEVYGNIYKTLTERGVVLVAPAGDQGSMARGASNRAGQGYVTGDYADYGLVASPAAYGESLAVASAQNDEYLKHAISAGKRNIMLYDGEEERFYYSFAGKKNLEYAIVPGDGGLGDYAGLQVEGRIALVTRGKRPFPEQVEQAAKAGALGILIANNEPGPLYLNLENPPIPAAAISQSDADYLRSIAKTLSGSGPAVGYSDTAEDLGGIYYRVTSQSQLVPGVYLLVNEQNSLALNAGSSAIGKSGNSLALQIKDGVIQAAAKVNGAAFRYVAGLIQTKEGKYLSRPKSDGLQLSASPENLTVTITDNGSADIQREGSALRYDENWKGFRFLGGDNPLLISSRAQIFLYKRGTALPVAPTAVGSVSFPLEMLTVHDEAGGLLSDFSAMGVSPELRLKPDLTGVGGNVSVPSRGSQTGYSVLSGTALSAAQSAGAMACLLQALKQRDPGQNPKARLELAKALLESSALVLTEQDGTVASPRRQGAGLMDLEAACRARAYITQPLLSLGDSKDGSYQLQFTLKSLSSQEIRYELGLTALADQAVTLKKLSYNSTSPRDVTREVRLTGKTTVTLPAGGSVKLSLKLQISDSLRSSLLKSFSNGAFLDGFLSLKEAEAPCTGGKSCPGAAFTDMPKVGNWAHAGIDYALNHGLFNGVSAASFSPEGSMTRAMMVTVLYRLAGKPKTQGNNPFTDVKPKQYYTNAVIWAAENGIVKGSTETEFSPNGDITREQITAILYRYALYVGAWTGDRAELSAYPDAAKVSKFAKTALAWAVGAGIVTGNKQATGTFLDPQGKATRAQVAAMFMRFAKNCLQGPAVLDSELHAAFTAFLGDWTKAPILEAHDWRETVDAENQLRDAGKDPAGWSGKVSFQVNTDVNRAWALDLKTLDAESAGVPAGDNPLLTQPYREAHIAISPESPLNAIAACPMLLRSARHLIMVASDVESGEVYRVLDTAWQPKARWDPATGAWQGTEPFLYDGTDAQGQPLPGGTRVRIDFYADLAYGKDQLGSLACEALLKKGSAWRVWSFTLTVDSQAPNLEDLVYDPAAKTLRVTVTEDQYLAALGLARGTDWSLELAGHDLAWLAGYSDSAPGKTRTVTIPDVEPGVYTLFAADYAANSSSVTLALGSGPALMPVRFACPEGFQIREPISLLASPGAEIPMPELEGQLEGAEFVGWSNLPAAEALSDAELAELGPAWSLALPGEAGRCGPDCVFYPMFRRVTGYGDPLTGMLEYPNGVEDYCGVWAFSCGSFFLDREGDAVELETEKRPEGWFLLTPEDSVLFAIDGDAEDGYIIQNRASKAYLTVKDGQLCLEARLTDGALWDLSYDAEAGSYRLLSLFDEESLMLYDKGKKCFTLVNQKRWIPQNQTLGLYGPAPNAWSWFTLGE